MGEVGLSIIRSVTCTGMQAYTDGDIQKLELLLWWASKYDQNIFLQYIISRPIKKKNVIIVVIISIIIIIYFFVWWKQ